MNETEGGSATTGRGLQARDVSLRLGGAQILDSASLDARPGELLGLLGPNGAGKSTLLRVMAGLLRPDAGEVKLDDTHLRALPAGERARRIAFMPQHDAQHPFTALETVLMGRYPHLGRFELEGAGDREIARAAMERTDTGDFEARQLDTLSGGERQRVLLARTLAQQASVLLLDEPAANLDLKHRLSIMDVLRAEIHEREIAVVMALHDLSLAGRYCDRLALMSNGSYRRGGRASRRPYPGQSAAGVRSRDFRGIRSGHRTAAGVVTRSGRGSAGRRGKGPSRTRHLRRGFWPGHHASTRQRRIRRFVERAWTRRHRSGDGRTAWRHVRARAAFFADR